MHGVAVRLAGDPSFRRRFAVTRVVTAGSPVSRMPLPKEVQLLALEHRTDPVLRLDHRAEPDAVNRIRVQADAAPPPGGQDTLTGSHAASRYADTAARQLGRGSDDPLLRGWYADNAPFLEGQTTTYDYLLTRPAEPPAESAPSSSRSRSTGAAAN